MIGILVTHLSVCYLISNLEGNRVKKVANKWVFPQFKRQTQLHWLGRVFVQVLQKRRMCGIPVVFCFLISNLEENRVKKIANRWIISQF